MKKKYLFIIPALALISFLGINSAQAFAGFGSMSRIDPEVAAKEWEQRMNETAAILGISVSEMKNYWSQGKTVQEIAKEKGISQADLQAKMKAARLAEMKTWLQTLVNKGFITQAQADARLKFMSEKSSKSGKGIRMGRGFGIGYGR